MLGAVWELAEASGLGFELWTERVPVRSETRAICAALGADPLRLISSGALLIAAADGAALAERIVAAGIACAPIGQLTESGRWLISAAGRQAAGPVLRDELWRLWD